MVKTRPFGQSGGFVKASRSAGELIIFAIGKVSGDMNYEVTLKWKKEKGVAK